MKSGLIKTRPDHRDYDFHKTFGVTAPPAFPLEYSTDAGFWMPNQSALGLPYGCTGFSGADARSDEDGVQYDPGDLYHHTPPGRDGEGREMRAMLDTLKTYGVKRYLTDELAGNKMSAYFQVRAAGFIDSFDAIRLAMLSTRDEKRAVVAGIPWYPEFQIIGQNGIMRMPDDLSLSRVTWHCVKIAGWTTINGSPYLTAKSWQGENYGDRGWAYMPRDVANVVLTTSGAAAFTVTKVAPNQVQRVNLDIVSLIVSYMRQLIQLVTKPPGIVPVPTPMTPPTTPPDPVPAPVDIEHSDVLYPDWDTPAHARHNVRALCDLEGLSLQQKDTLTACVAVESGFHIHAVNKNYLYHHDGTKYVGSTDWGICQWNDYYHGAEITPDEAMNDPEKAVRLMCKYWKAGLMRQWVSYTSGAYKHYL